MQKLFIKLSCICTIIILAATASKAQTWAWANKGNGKGYGNSLCADENGNIVMAGDFTSPMIAFGTHTLNCSGASEAFIVKYDPNGNVMWAQGSTGAEADAYSVNTDLGGNIYLTGTYTGSTVVFGSYTLTATGAAYYDHVFLVKYDASGNVMWAKSSDGTDGAGTSVCIDANGNAYVTGYFNGLNGPISFDSYTFNIPGNHLNIFLVKYDPNGNVVWAKSSDGAGYNTPGSLSLDVSGNIFITGSFKPIVAFGSYTLNSAGDSDGFIAKYDPNGNVLWVKSNGGVGYDQVSGVSTDLNGNAYITGSVNSSTITFGSITLTNTSTFSGNIFLAKYDAGGNAVWAKILTNSLSSMGRSVFINANTIYVTGYFYQQVALGSQTLVAPANATDPVFIARYNLNGTLINSLAISSGGSDQSDMCADQLCNLYIAGTFQPDSFIVGTNTLIGSGHRNPFAAKLSFTCLTEGITRLSNEDKDISISPNPAFGRFTVNLKLALNSESVEIYNSLGQMINNSYLLSDKNEIDISDQANGIYFINVYREGRLVTQKKIIKE